MHPRSVNAKPAGRTDGRHGTKSGSGPARPSERGREPRLLRSVGHRRLTRPLVIARPPEAPTAEQLPPGRYDYGEPPGWFEDTDEGGMRGQPASGLRGYSALTAGANYPISDSPTASYPHTEPFREYGEGIHESLVGKGPRGYQRSDQRIREDVCDSLTDAPIDASDIDVVVKDGVVTLTGVVQDKHAQRLAEDVVEELRGVTSVESHLHVKRSKAGKR